MKALTISQPWASLIASGKKWIENRTWATNYRGGLAIHAGKGTQYMTRRELAAVPTGRILATATLSACIPMTQILEYSRHHAHKCQRVPFTQRSWEELALHQYTEGPFCWVLENITPLETPVVINGAIGLWEWDS